MCVNVLNRYVPIKNAGFIMREFLKKNLDPMIPLYSVIPLITCFAFNTLVYYGAMSINSNRYHYDFTTNFDRSVPIIPIFVIIYFICYGFWAINYIIIGRIGREHCMRFVFADISSRCICLIFFILIPTTNIRPEILGNGIGEQLLRHLYSIDHPENLFPSIHCLVSWFCYIGIRGQKQVPRWYRAFSCVFALAVCLSTQLTKQHYIIDVFGGILIAELTYYIAHHSEWYRGVEKIFNKISALVFGKNNIGL
ncbi:PAP2 superfamily protein [[Clostridium] fimetarium]|uniref:PAP2 superfamily protein n=2 Tax=[Clostridium] fimetarium TaxID=99656 RepID=A0A1I0R2Z5_9FIRM|nr:PAP2 superfamily protein [[Clostridium] fimetarium]